MRMSKGYEARKVQITGGGTFIVSLPKEWASTNKLAKGSQVFLRSQADGTLSLQSGVNPEGEPKRKVCLVSNSSPESHILRTLIAEYIAGFPMLEVRTQGRMSAQTRKVVREFAQRVVGPEILEETSDVVVMQEMVTSNPLPLPSVLRRMHSMARAMQTDAMTAFVERNTAIARDVIERDREVDRFNWFVNKTVQTAMRQPGTLSALDLTLPECLTYLLASRVLERIADHAVRIAEVTEWVTSNRIPASSAVELSKLSEVTLGLLDRAVSTLFTGKIEEANDIIDKVGELIASRPTTLEEIFSSRGRVAVALAYVLESVERTAQYTSDLAEIAMNHSATKVAA